jgi:hypothetical protein
METLSQLSHHYIGEFEMSLREQFLGLSRVIKTEFEKISSQIPHAGERGASREEILTKSLVLSLIQRTLKILTLQPWQLFFSF